MESSSNIQIDKNSIAPAETDTNGKNCEVRRYFIPTVMSLTIFIFLIFHCSAIKQVSFRIKSLDYVEPRLGMETYILFSDLHFFSPYAPDMDLTYEENTVYLGDIFDLKYCKEKDVPVVLDSINQLRSRVGIRYLPGNHELGSMEGSDWLFIENGILFTHGHQFICWSDKMVEEWKHELEEGKSTLGRNITKIEYFIWDKPSHRPKQRYISNAIRLATKYGCHTIVFGHTHTKKLFDQTYQNETGEAIRVINVPRGKTVIEL